MKITSESLCPRFEFAFLRQKKELNQSILLSWAMPYQESTLASI